MDIAYPHVAERLFGRAHAIEPMALRAIMDGPIARRILSGAKIDADHAKKSRDVRRSRMATIVGAEQVTSQDGIIDFALTSDGIAIISVCGVLSRRFDWLAAACGWSTYEGVGTTLSAALDDYRVKAVLFDIDSPGGEADGMLDLADQILAARGSLPVWAVANTLAASAAYALGGSADHLMLPRLAEVGSIGCVMVHVDQSSFDAAEGLSYTAIYSGARKIDGWGHAPLSDGARASAQAGVDHVRQQFAALIGRQGRVSAQDAIATEAAVYVDQAAVDAGLADAVGTFTDALTELTAEVTPQFRSGGIGMSARKHTPRHAAVTDALVPVEEIAAATAGAAEVADPLAASDRLAAEAASTPSMTAPAAGEKCMLCGQMMPEPGDDPDDGEPDADPDDKNTSAAGASAQSPQPAAASIAAYGEKEITETVDLCHIAGMPGKSREFIAAKTPLEQVRASLLSIRADAANSASLSTVDPSSINEKSGETRMKSWRETQQKVLRDMGIVRD